MMIVACYNNPKLRYSYYEVQIQIAEQIILICFISQRQKFVKKFLWTEYDIRLYSFSVSYIDMKNIFGLY
jgi:hypothetical protein